MMKIEMKDTTHATAIPCFAYTKSSHNSPMSLTSKELSTLTRGLNPTSSILASTIAKLVLASPDPKTHQRTKAPNSLLTTFPKLSFKEWTETGVHGGLVLVVDRALGAAYLQIFDLSDFTKRFQYEAYFDMEYMDIAPDFHAFEMDECIAGLSFMDSTQARRFLVKTRAAVPSKANGDRVLIMNVVHRQHVGLNQDGTLDLNGVSKEWVKVMKQAGVKKRDLRNPETARALIQSIQQSGYSLAVAPGAYVQTNVTEKPQVGQYAERRNQKKSRQFTDQDVKKHYTMQQFDQYDEYRKQLAAYELAQKKYVVELAEYERLMKLQEWERDNEQFLQEQERLKRTSKDTKYTTPPPLPPRRKKADGARGSDLSSPGHSPTLVGGIGGVVIPTVGKKSVPVAAAASAYETNHLPLPRQLPPRPASPLLPDTPALPNIEGESPLKSLQEQLQAIALRPSGEQDGKMVLRAMAGSQVDLAGLVRREQKKPDHSTDNLVNTLVSALAARRAQLTQNGADDADDEGDDWSD